MTNGESLAKTNQRTIHSLIAFLVCIMFFHSASCNAFVFGLQASQRSPKTPSKTIQLTNNSPAIITSSFLQLPNDSPAKQRYVPNDDSELSILQICVPTTTTSTGLQASNNRHSSLNEVTAPQAFSAMTTTMTVTMTKVPAITTAITKATIKLVECFLHPAKTGANNATNKSESLLLHALFGSAITTARIHTPSLLLLYLHDNSAIMTALNTQNLLLFFVQNDPASQASKLIVKYSKTSLHFHKDCGTFCEGE
jgi:hypothetical protein